MRVIIACFILFSSYVFGADLQEKIQNFITLEGYQKNANFIQKIFKDEKAFYYGSNLDIPKIINALKSNGLLSLKLPKPSNISITFRINSIGVQTDTEPSFLFLSYATNTMLTNMGYSYFYTTQAKKQQNKISLTYTLNAESNIDPMVAISNLSKLGYRIVDINRYSQTHWIYDISLIRPIVTNADMIQNNDNVITKLNGKYWFSVNTIGSLNITPQPDVIWYPKILVFDSDMNLIDAIMLYSAKDSYTLKITKQTQYIFITDNYNPSILRNGITLNFQPN